MFEICKFTEHAKTKDKLLSYFENQNSSPSPEIKDRISNTDFFTDCGEEREYHNFIYPVMKPYFQKMFYDTGYSKYDIDIELENYWFQQYYENDYHEWHVHTGRCDWSFVYYVELPNNGPKTEIKLPFSGEIIIPPVKEGDILMFPSSFLHRSASNKSMERKTILAWNFKYCD